MIRLRRVTRRFPWGRVYEVEFDAEGETKPVARVTRDPVTVIEPYLGVGDAWALVDAADRRWTGEIGDWVTLFTAESAES